jgi:hypothetical protein
LRISGLLAKSRWLKTGLLFSAIAQRRGFGSFDRQAHGTLTVRRHKPSGIGVPEKVHFTEF